MSKYSLVALTLWLGFICPAVAEDPNDTYPYRSECPENGAAYERNGTADNNNFVRCQCTSYVAHKLNELWGSTNPRFTNQYYGFDRWGNAVNWLNRARSDRAEIGVTGAQDNFSWEPERYNAVFRGDIAYWDTGTYGHVAFVESATSGPNNRGVGCVTISEYNGTNTTTHNFNRRTLCRNADGTFPAGFPRYFLHIDQDRTYCSNNPTVDTCATLMGGVATAGLSKYVSGLGGGGGSDPFNLKINNFWVTDAASAQLVSDTTTLKPNQVITVKVQVKAKDGNTSTHMRSGKDRIEVDIYMRQDTGDWTFLKREYIQATNLPSGGTHTESVSYAIPSSASSVSFKAKIDAEDEAYEANEGDNWSRIETFQVARRTPEERKKFMRNLQAIIND